jgi:hypothetical protein
MTTLRKKIELFAPNRLRRIAPRIDEALFASYILVQKQVQ